MERSGSRRDTERAMSEENLHAWQEAVDAYNRGDRDSAVKIYGTHAEWRPAVQRLIGGDTAVYRGRAGVREFFRDLDDAFAEIRIDIAEAHDLGDRAVFLGRFYGRGKESGAETRSPIAYLVDFENGRVIRVVSYLNHDEALQAAGLRD
jgi:ketosteroid isomerase-like protein